MCNNVAVYFTCYTESADPRNESDIKCQHFHGISAIRHATLAPKFCPSRPLSSTKLNRCERKEE